jgi:hypothetical protein
VQGSWPHIEGMDALHAKNRKMWREAKWFQRFMMGLGWALILGAVAIGPLPGPGPLVLAPIGMALILKNSIWAKRHYARLTKRHPQYGDWMHWMLGRSKIKEKPPLPPVKADIMRLFRRDDLDQDMP